MGRRYTDRSSRPHQHCGLWTPASTDRRRAPRGVGRVRAGSRRGRPPSASRALRPDRAGATGVADRSDVRRPLGRAGGHAGRGVRCGPLTRLPPGPRARGWPRAPTQFATRPHHPAAVRSNASLGVLNVLHGDRAGLDALLLRRRGKPGLRAGGGRVEGTAKTTTTTRQPFHPNLPRTRSTAFLEQKCTNSVGLLEEGGVPCRRSMSVLARARPPTALLRAFREKDRAAARRHHDHRPRLAHFHTSSVFFSFPTNRLEGGALPHSEFFCPAQATERPTAPRPRARRPALRSNACDKCVTTLRDNSVRDALRALSELECTRRGPWPGRNRAEPRCHAEGRCRVAVGGDRPGLLATHQSPRWPPKTRAFETRNSEPCRSVTVLQRQAFARVLWYSHSCRADAQPAQRTTRAVEVRCDT